MAGNHKVFDKWSRFLLWYLFGQAELFTSIQKNDLEIKGAVEYNGFVIARKGVPIKEMPLADDGSKE